MNEQLFESLLFEEESTTLDFKRDQYRFKKASDEEKSELLKDILGFANAWRRAEAYILIGVDDVRGGRSNVVGIPASEHLDDHSLQQFVNNLTNRPVRFHYEAFGFEEKQIGIIRIDDQQARPVFLKKDYGSLKKDDVYVRRGSSTDPTKPARPDEIATMGAGPAVHDAELTVEFAEVGRDEALGTRIPWNAEFCEMPGFNEIPELSDQPKSFKIGPHTVQLPNLESISLHDRLNTHYHHELANFLFFQKLFRRVRLVITNTGPIAATEVHLEVSVTTGQGIGIANENEAPDMPEERVSRVASQAMQNLRFRRHLAEPGDVEIKKDDGQIKLEIGCGNIQPGRQIWTEPFYLAFCRSGEIELDGSIFASNIPQPKKFSLSVNAKIETSTMTVDELLAAGDALDSR